MTIVTGLAIAGTLTVSSMAAPPESAVAGWPRQSDGPGVESFDDVVVNSSGDVYVVGSSTAAMPGQVHAGLSDVIVAKYDKYGRFKWLRQIGTTAEDTGAAIALSGSSIYVAGATSGTLGTPVGSSDGFVTKYDSNGNQKWLTQFGTTDNDYIADLAVSGSDVFVVGATEGTFPNNPTVLGSSDAFVARFSTSGAFKSVKQFGTVEEDNGHTVAVSGSDVYVGGFSKGNIGGGGVDPDGDVFVARLDKSGNQKALIQFGSTALDYVMDVAVRSTGVYVAGYTQGTLPNAQPVNGPSDGFLIRYDRALAAPVWTRQIDTGANDVIGAINVNSSGLFVAGQTNGAVTGFTNLGSNDGFVSRYDVNGNQTWIRQFGTSALDGVGGIATRSSDNYGGAVIVVGGTGGTIFGQADAAGTDAFVATFLK